MSDPRIGMRYDDVAKRIKRLVSDPRGNIESKRRMIDSLTNQCRLCEGESALTALAHECAFKKTDSIFSGGGNKQTGYGPGHKLGDGKWVRTEKGKWERA